MLSILAAPQLLCLSLQRRRRSSTPLTFGLEGEVAELADVGPDVRVGPDVFLQHAGLLAADAALLADVLPPAAAAHIDVVLVGLVPGKRMFCGVTNKQTNKTKEEETIGG